MTDAACVQFLQWALPRLRMRWAGFRKVHGQVCRRIDRRLREIGLPDVSVYPSFLEAHPAEWTVLDGLCRISISRFYRDRAVFQFLEREVLPALARIATAHGQSEVRCWSIGCAAGEEPYTVAILWRLAVEPGFPGVKICILATDADPHAIERAGAARYAGGSLRDLPGVWRTRALVASAGTFSVSGEFRAAVTFRCQDIRVAAPNHTFHLVLCRNLAFTYFDDALQREVLSRVLERLIPGGGLLIGARETLPQGFAGLEPWPGGPGAYRKSADPSVASDDPPGAASG